MRFVPLLKVANLSRALKFYTGVLDFQIAPYEDLDSPVIDLLREGAKVQLSEFDGASAIAVNVEVAEVDDLFQKYLDRGLDTSSKPNSPVHQGPIDQTWGTREFYVTDPDGTHLDLGRLDTRNSYGKSYRHRRRIYQKQQGQKGTRGLVSR